MNLKFLRDRRLFNSEGGGAAAAATPSDPGGGAASSAAAAVVAAPSPSAAAADPAGGATTPAGDLYKPEGLAEQYVGANNNETIDKLKAAVEGYRNRDAQNHVPDTTEAYGQFTGELPDAIKPHIETLAGDPLFARVSDKALALKVSVPVYQALVQEFVSVSHEMGMMEPIVDEKAERAALVPDTAKHLAEAEQKTAVDKRMNDNFAFMDVLVMRGIDPVTKQFNPALGGLQKDDVDFAKAMLGDSAKGHRVMEWMRNSAGGGSGGGPAMQHGTTTPPDAKAALRERSALPQNTVGHKDFDRASWDQLQADYKKVHGN